MASALALSGSAVRARHLPSDAFVWQRAWKPAVSRAVTEAGDAFATWHVLVAELSADASPALAHPDWAVLRAGGHEVVPVVRIEGRIDGARIAGLVEQLRAVLAGLPVPVRRVEIDHDAATAGLADYAAFLRALKAGWPAGREIWVTTLPTWIGSPGFPGLAAAANRLVLQVHAVDDPRLGLFGADRALGFVRALAWRAPHIAFEVALPAYGARVTGSGTSLAVSAEMAAEDAGPGQEIAADPVEVARFVEAVQRDPPDRLAGLVWFRLPVAGDARAWGAATLRDVAGGRAPEARVAVAARAGRLSGVTDIVLVNTGRDDAVPPRHIALPQNCVAADGVGQYVLEPGRLSRRGAGLLRGGASVPAGWMRCSGDLHASD